MAGDVIVVLGWLEIVDNGALPLAAVPREIEVMNGVQ
jgi:hypothetical protein